MKRFLTLAEVCEILQISMAQAYSLVRGGELEAIQVGGRGQWRVEIVKLDEYVERQYAITREATSSAAKESGSSAPSTKR